MAIRGAGRPGHQHSKGELGLRDGEPGRLSPGPSLVGGQTPEQPAAPEQAWVALGAMGRGGEGLGKGS